MAFLTFSQPVDNTTVSIDGVALLPTSSDTTLMMAADLSITGNQNLYNLRVTVPVGTQESEWMSWSTAESSHELAVGT